MEGYELIHNWCTPAYSYIEGDEKELYWVDSQNCIFHIVCDETDEETGKRFDGKKYWIIEPHKPKGVQITNENYNEVKEQFKWIVTDSSEEQDTDREWDFDKHMVI